MTATIGPASTLEDVVANGIYGLRICANGDTLAGLDLSGTLTRAQLEAAIAATLAALPTPKTPADLRAVPEGRSAGSATGGAPGEEARAASGGFTVYSVTTYGWSASCRLNSTSGSGSGYSTAYAAGQALFAWAATANCPPGGGSARAFPEG